MRIFFILVDALRLDAARTMRAYQGMCAQGVEFCAHRSTNTWTLPALGTLFTGCMAADHGLHNWREGDLAPRLMGDGGQTLAEVLHAFGWTTIAYASCGWGQRAFGFDRGFDRYDEGTWTCHNLKRIMSEIPTEGNVFAFIHLLGVHNWFIPSYNENELVKYGQWINNMQADPAVADKARSLYAERVKELDAQLCELTFTRGDIIILTADHGELFGDDGPHYMMHGPTVPPCKRLVEIPLVITGLPDTPRVVEQRTWDYDIMQTIINLATADREGGPLVLDDSEGINILAPGPLPGRMVPVCSSPNAARAAGADAVQADQLRGLGYL